ncbi:LacI family DNA-binding transcriptional regulator [Aureimonas sp. Leaf454]|uniref:LacI family DNA-binding transcriptional regulator n=1 Tax=Aureimonas sp. Leaf454 TaxID=1736381 RepID=UPI000ADB6483|nr:LacI family DNA-binding transcriptional regulator [Aureimonas sp. Leaf454]
MSKDRISIKDVSALAGVSAATVSNVFSGRKPVNRDLQERVRKAASQLGYLPDRAASQLRSGRTNVVAVLVPDLTDTFFATIVTRFEALAQADGYDVIVASSRDTPAIEASRLEALLAFRPAGMIAVPCSNEVPEALAAEAQRMPVVLVDRVALPCTVADTVTIDNRDAGAVAARHLVEHGHRDIVLAASRMSMSPIEERVQSAADHILRETGRHATILELGTNVDEGTAIFARWLERHDVPDAVLASTNVTTLSVLSTFAAFRIAIPDRVSMIAFDDDAWMRARNTGLTAIRQPVEEIAEAAWDRLRLRMREGVSTPPVSIVMNAGLVVRSSVGQRIPETAALALRASPRPAPASAAADEPLH